MFIIDSDSIIAPLACPSLRLERALLLTNVCSKAASSGKNYPKPMINLCVNHGVYLRGLDLF
ncbi:MAG: hypothetical protein CM15mP73_5370 [Hyphomicrobiales bacterium]|nr:MAG: hypothetical protein CM15mP73_5370 [Hyphomicrobiales bacterium]